MLYTVTSYISADEYKIQSQFFMDSVMLLCERVSLCVCVKPLCWHRGQIHEDQIERGRSVMCLITDIYYYYYACYIGTFFMIMVKR